MRSFCTLCALGLLLLAAAPLAAQTTGGDFWHCPEEVAGQTLHVYNWTTYIAEDTISNFERLCHVTIVYTTYASDTDMIDELRAGNPGYDVVVPTDANVYTMIEDKLLEPLSMSAIPNFANIGTTFKQPPYDPSNTYTVPYQWGTVGVGYNRTKVGKDITSWNDVFNYTGPVAWLDESRSMLGIALRVLGDDPNTSDAAQIDAAAQFLIDHKANVAQIAPDTGQDLLAAKTVDIAVEYSGDIFQLISDCQCNDFAYAIPDEGAVIWIDNLAIPVGAQNPTLAAVFINYILNPQVGADISNYTAYASPNQAAQDQGLISSRYQNNPAIYPDDQVLSRLFYNVSNAQLEQLFGAAWAKVKSAVGK
jgi:spermidine/putrescine transport system substrate-binding protein